MDDSGVIEDARDVVDVDAAGVEFVEDVVDNVDEVDEMVDDVDEVVDEHLFNVFLPSLFILTSNTDFKCMPTLTHQMSTHLKKGVGF